MHAGTRDSDSRVCKYISTSFPGECWNLIKHGQKQMVQLAHFIHKMQSPGSEAVLGRIRWTLSFSGPCLGPLLPPLGQQCHGDDMLSPPHPELQRSLFCSGVRGRSVPPPPRGSFQATQSPSLTLLCCLPPGLFFEDCLPGLSSAPTHCVPFLTSKD